MNNEVKDKFIKDFEICDKNLTGEVVTTSFTGSQTTIGKISGTLEMHLLRFQFIEFIIRLANAKYRESGRVQLHSEALRMLLDKDINPHASEIIEEWDHFRQRRLWTIEVNDIFKPNIPNLQVLMKKFYEPRKNTLNMHDAMSIFSTLTQQVSENTALHIYGMSKMTNIYEAREITKHKNLANVTELIEMIGRCAEYKYKEEDALTLVEKIVRVLDVVLELVKLTTVVPVLGEAGDESESDEDY